MIASRNSTTEVLGPRRLDDLIEGGGANAAGGIACGGRMLSYERVDRLSTNLASSLAQHGVTPGERVIVALPNCVEFVVAAFAIWKAGGVFVPVDPAVCTATKARIFEQTTPLATIVRSQFLRDVADSESVRGIRSVYLHDDDASAVAASGAHTLRLADALERDDSSLVRGAVDPDAVVSVSFTSGSTGEPKGVMHTHASWLSGVRFTASHVGLSSDDQMVIPLPIHHAYAFRQVLAYALAGARVLFTRDVYEALRVLPESRPSALLLVPAACAIALEHFPRQLHDADEHLRYVEIGSAAMTPERVDQLRALLPTTEIHLPYGLTEARVGYLGRGADGRFNRLRHVADGLEVDVVSSAGGEIASGEAGEIRLRGAGLTCGYWGSSETERAQLRREGFRTGDRGEVDAEGVVGITGRVDDVLKIGGRKVAPAEIEAVLEAHEDISEAAVVGRASAQSLLEVELHAYVALAAAREFDAATLETFCRTRLEAFKVPAAFHVVDRLPRTAIGKVDRRTLEGGEALPRSRR